MSKVVRPPVANRPVRIQKTDAEPRGLEAVQLIQLVPIASIQAYIFWKPNETMVREKLYVPPSHLLWACRAN